MINPSIYFKAGLILMSALTMCVGYSQTRNTVTLVPDQENIKISRHIYGHFAEHLGRCIYDGFYVGEDNAAISHTAGVRNDVVAALKKLNIPNLRWPGGCFADTYHWKDGIGPKSNRPTIVNNWWGGVTEDNSFGTHDFLNMCELLETEPYLAGNVGSGEVQELADWVQYVNHNGKSPMADLRRANGREEPWKVKYWGVGNEAWGCGGNMTAEYYANVYRQYATFMADWTNTGGLFRVASGASGNDYKWTETLMKNIPGSLVEGMALHHYANVEWSKKGPATGYNEEQYFKTLRSAWEMEELVTKHSQIMDKYDPNNKIALIVDEWGGWYDVEEGTNPGFLYQQNTMRDAMIAGLTLNVFNNHANRVKMANLAQTINVLQAVILTKEDQMILTPTYHVMEMYKEHQDARLIPVKLESANYTFEGQSLPAIHASASNKEGKTSISLVNIDAKQGHLITLALDRNYSQASARILTSKELTNHNTFEHPDNIQPTDFKLSKISDQKLDLTIPPFSVLVVTLE